MSLGCFLPPRFDFCIVLPCFVQRRCENYSFLAPTQLNRRCVAVEGWRCPVINDDVVLHREAAAYLCFSCVVLSV